MRTENLPEAVPLNARRDLERQESGRSTTRWQCCLGGTTDKRLLLFAAQVGVSLAVLALASVKLMDPEISCSDQSTFVGLVTLVFGLWAQSPLA